MGIFEEPVCEEVADIGTAPALGPAVPADTGVCAIPGVCCGGGTSEPERTGVIGGADIFAAGPNGPGVDGADIGGTLPLPITALPLDAGGVCVM